MLVKKKLKNSVRLIIKDKPGFFLYCLEKDIEISFSETRSEFYPYHVIEKSLDQVILKNIKISKLSLFKPIISNICIDFKNYRLNLHYIRQIHSAENIFDGTCEIFLTPDYYTAEFFN